MFEEGYEDYYNGLGPLYPDDDEYMDGYDYAFEEDQDAT